MIELLVASSGLGSGADLQLHRNWNDLEAEGFQYVHDRVDMIREPLIPIHPRTTLPLLHPSPRKKKKVPQVQFVLFIFSLERIQSPCDEPLKDY